MTTQTITVPIANDTVFENSETFNVNLVTPTNATISDNLGVGTITDNDTAPALSVSSATVAESAGFAQFTVSLSAASGVATAVNLALGGGTATGGGTDYGSGTVTNIQTSIDGGLSWVDGPSVTIAVGATSVLVRTPINNDTISEVSETFNLTATPAVAGRHRMRLRVARSRSQTMTQHRRWQSMM